MPAIIKSLDEFLERIEIEGPVTKFTWLVGAGISASAGIPLAEGVSKRIIVFEYIVRVLKYRPWDRENKDRITYQKMKDLDDFFNWFDKGETGPVIKERESEEEGETELEEGQVLVEKEVSFQKHLDNALVWLNTKEGFENTSYESADCYQKLFGEFLMNPQTNQIFLSSLVRRAKGINLAHLCLAGILRDYHREWGHTVFTTNFDDLLLKAILSIGYTARVYGDVDSSDNVNDNPRYPQIVHLHGRHTGYNLLNTNEEVAEYYNSGLQEDFEGHLNNSNLIVLGYSGWNDMVKATLEKWKEKNSLLQGNLYWIPHRSREEIKPKMWEFLNSFQNKKVIIIENEEQDLNADSFMLAFSETLNKDNGGFGKYRKEMLEIASNQHKYILNQLQEYSDFAPNRIFDIIKKSYNSLVRGDRIEARKYILEASKIVESADLPNEFRAPAFLRLGIVSNLLDVNDLAEKYLMNGLEIWGILKSQSNFSRKYGKGLGLSLQAVGEYHFKCGDYDEALIWFKKARYRFEQTGLKLGFAYANINIAEVYLRFNKPNTVQEAGYCVSITEPIFKKYDDHYGLTLFNKIKALVAENQKKLKHAEIHYKMALSHLEQANDDELLKGHIHKGLGLALVKDARFDEGEIHLESALKIYKDRNYLLGIANVECCYADHFFLQRDFEKALEKYLIAYELYKEKESIQGLTNVIADIIRCKQKNPELELDTLNFYEEGKLLLDKKANTYLEKIINQDSKRFNEEEE